MSNTSNTSPAPLAGGARSKKTAAKKTGSWKAGAKVAVKCKGADGKFHVVQRTAYRNSAYPGEVRICKVKDGKKSFVKFAKQ